ncbi:ExbD/TolR family protein [Qipengyuania nanhaisediminis]|uniref:ExbD/TolR family protein n=1 Tax=Qipengyuania nanhaisediminis TaxID=604088 RepID=UPI0038B3BAE6
MAIASPGFRSRFSGQYDPRGRHKRSRRAMGEMNVTPFIDVLLVLLVMLILAVPIKPHVTQVDLPGETIDPPFAVLAENTVAISEADELSWNGAPLTRDQLAAQVAAAAASEDEPLLRFEPAALASYDTSARTLTLIKDAGAKRFAFIGNHRHRDWD